MPTRREFVAGLATVPLAAHLPASESTGSTRVEIWHEDHGLSEESAVGFQRTLDCECIARGARSYQDLGSSLIVLPGAKRLSLEDAVALREQIRNGAWVVLESGLSFSTGAEARQQAEVCAKIFHLRLLPQTRTANHAAGLSYIEYAQPARHLVRTFESITPVCCDARDVLACFAGSIVCVRKTIGRGGLIYLGSMLGPGLYAEEREAKAVASGLIGLRSSYCIA